MAESSWNIVKAIGKASSEIREVEEKNLANSRDVRRERCG